MRERRCAEFHVVPFSVVLSIFPTNNSNGEYIGKCNEPLPKNVVLLSNVDVDFYLKEACGEL